MASIAASPSAASLTTSPMVQFSLRSTPLAAHTVTSYPLSLPLLLFTPSSHSVLTLHIVTSVSATQFLWDGTNIQSEVTASIQSGAKITTGGGFSTFQPQVHILYPFLPLLSLPLLSFSSFPPSPFLSLYLHCTSAKLPNLRREQLLQIRRNLATFVRVQRF